MGLFSDACPNCRARVKKRANFCSRCGWAGENSLTSCPACDHKVGRTSRFCWHCGADLVKEKPPRIMGDRWVREDEEIAVRVNPSDLKGFFSRRVTVEPGTIGLIERNGRIEREQEWGTHTLEKLIQLRNPSSIILVSAGDIVLRPTFQGLRDAQGAQLDLTVQTVLRVSDYDAFVKTFFEGHKRRVTHSVLENAISHELLDVARGLVAGKNLAEMYGNLAWRDELEAKLRDTMMVTLGRYGLDLIQLNFVELGGDDFEQLQQDRGEAYMGNHAADHLAQKQSIRRRMAELEADGKLSEAETAKELVSKVEELNRRHNVRNVLGQKEQLDTIEQARQELELRRRLRTFEVEDLDDERAKQKQDEQVAREQMLEKMTVGHQNEVAMDILAGRNMREGTEAEFLREQKRLQDDVVRDKDWLDGETRRRQEKADAVQRYELIIQESRTNLEAAKSNVARELEDAKAKRSQVDLSVYEESEKQRLKKEYEEHEVALLRQVKQLEMESLQANHHFELEMKRLDKDTDRLKIEKDAEVQLAGIQGNVDIASADNRVDAATARAVADQLKERLDDQKGDKDAMRSDSNRRADDLKEMARVLGTGGGARASVGGGGVQGGPGNPSADADSTPCPNCGRPVALTDNFCRGCGHNMTERAK